jgi:hypothetical protein
MSDIKFAVTGATQITVVGKRSGVSMVDIGKVENATSYTALFTAFRLWFAPLNPGVYRNFTSFISLDFSDSAALPGAVFGLPVRISPERFLADDTRHSWSPPIPTIIVSAGTAFCRTLVRAILISTKPRIECLQTSFTIFNHSLARQV